MPFLICERHQKSQTHANRLATNAYICLNRYCPDSYRVICDHCRKDHKDHAVKLLTIEDVAFLVDRLLKVPPTTVNKCIGDAVDVMKKLKLIGDFKKKIDDLERQIQKDALKLIEQTQAVIDEFATCKKEVGNLHEFLSNIDKPKSYNEFFKQSTELFSYIDYNFKKDKFEYESSSLKEKEEKRRKILEVSKQTIDEMKDYSMKIIEVILQGEDFDSEEEDLQCRKKQYDILKQETTTNFHSEEDEEILEQKISRSTKATLKTQQPMEKGSQTMSDWGKENDRLRKEFNTKIQKMKSSNAKNEDELKSKITVLTKEKEGLSKEITKIKQKQELKSKKVIEIEAKLRKQKQERQEKENIQKDAFEKLVDLGKWKKADEEDKK